MRPCEAKHPRLAGLSPDQNLHLQGFCIEAKTRYVFPHQAKVKARRGRPRASGRGPEHPRPKTTLHCTTSTPTDPEQLLVVSNSPVTAPTHAPSERRTRVEGNGALLLDPGSKVAW